MGSTSDMTGLVDNLTAYWTDPALEILKSAGLERVTVDMEVATWRSLRAVLRYELRWQRSFRLSTLVSLSMLTEQVLRKATFLVARKYAPQCISMDFKKHVRRLVGERRASAAERHLYSRIILHPSLRAAFKPVSRTDFTPHLRLLAAAN
jgi:hypothetical protein